MIPDWGFPIPDWGLGIGDWGLGERDFYAYASVNDAVKQAKDVTGTVVDWAAVRSFAGAEKQTD
jgi:hypothetical protein